MECTEIVVQKTYTEEEVYTEVYTTLIERKNAASVLEMFCNDVPLQNYGLNHLKRIQPLDRSARGGPLQIVVCPVHSFDEVPQHVRDVCSEKQVVKVCSIAPTTRPEFEAWNKCWPINFHASHLEKEREKGLTREDLQQVEQAFHWLQADAESHRWGGGVAINPENSKVVATASETMTIWRQRCPDAGTEWENKACTTVYTPTMLCIEGVAAVVRGEVPSRGTCQCTCSLSLSLYCGLSNCCCLLQLSTAESLPPNAYLCSGLDLYLTHEPDLMAAMALVHSRIRRVFFQHADPKMGALLSGRGHIHCLRSLNHHYRVFLLKPGAYPTFPAVSAEPAAGDKLSRQLCLSSC
jgi:hypothetical protein